MTSPPGTVGAVAPPAASPLADATPLVAWLAGRAALGVDALRSARASDPGATASGAADPERLARALVAAGRPADALRIVAVALPPREGIWWAWVAARHALQTREAAHAAPPSSDAPVVQGVVPPSPAEAAALAAVERWIAQPTDEHRRAAWDAAQAAGLETAVGTAAAAVYFATGSLAPVESPMAVPPPPGAHATFAAGAAMLAAAETDAMRLAEVAGAFITQGVEVVRRLGGWEQAAIAARQHFDAQREVHARAQSQATGAVSPQAAAPGGG